MNFDYFYNRQSEMYNFIRLPMVLMEDEIFESISIEAKVLYSYMLNRMGLSYKNGWIDKETLLESAKAYGKSPYGQHLKNVSEGKIIY